MSLVVRGHRAAPHEAQKHDQLSVTHDKTVESPDERSGASDALRRALIADGQDRLRMFESHEGVVMHVDDDSVVVTYSIGEDYVDQTYRKEQFIGGRLPKKGDRLAICVHVAEVPKQQDREPTSAPSPDEQRRHRKGAIRPPREF